jgi:hypothetical protein
VAWWINAYFGLTREQQVDKRSEAVAKIAQWVDEQYCDGRTTSISDEEMVQAVRRSMPEIFERRENSASALADGQ